MEVNFREQRVKRWKEEGGVASRRSLREPNRKDTKSYNEFRSGLVAGSG